MIQSKQTLKKNQQKTKPPNDEPKNYASAKRASKVTKSKVKKNAAKPKSYSNVNKCKVKLNAAGLYEWEKVATKAMARSNKTQVLVSFNNHIYITTLHFFLTYINKNKY
jgi:hypothetical protein